MTRLVHTTDTYLDRKNMGRARRRRDFQTAFAEVVSHSIENSADALLHTGNVFWSQSPEKESVQFFRDQLKRLQAAGIDFHIVYGKHDFRTERVLEDVAEDGLLTRLTAGWHVIGDVGLLVFDHETNPEASTAQYPPDDITTRVAVSSVWPPATADIESVRELEAEIGWKLSAAVVGGRETRIEKSESTGAVYSPGAPERIIGKAYIEMDAYRTPSFLQYESSASEFVVEKIATSPRPVSAFSLDLDPDASPNDVREQLPPDVSDDAAVLFEITGQKHAESLDRREVQQIVEEHAVVVRGYDDRTHLDPSAGEQAESTAEKPHNERSSPESRSATDATEQTNEADPTNRESLTRIIAFGHVDGSSAAIERIAKETEGLDVAAYVYTGSHRSLPSQPKRSGRDLEDLEGLKQLAEKAPVYLAPRAERSVWERGDGEYAPASPPESGSGTGDESSIQEIPLTGRIPLGSIALTRNPWLEDEDVCLVTHEARPDLWRGGHAAYIAGNHYVGRYDRRYLNTGFSSFDPGVGRDVLYGQYFELRFDEEGLRDVSWYPLGVVQELSCPEHTEYGMLYLLEGLSCPFCEIERHAEAGADAAAVLPSTTYEQAYLVASDGIPAKRTHHIAYYQRYDVDPPEETAEWAFPAANTDGQETLDQEALEAGDLRGELMYFLEEETTDQTWLAIKDLVKEGVIYDARVSTAFTLTARGDSRYLLFVTIPNYTDRVDAHRVHERLIEELNLDDPVSVKPTRYTSLGIYSSNADEWDLPRSTRYVVHAGETGATSGDLSPSPDVNTGELPRDLVERDQWILWKPSPDGRKVPRAPWNTGDDTFVSAMDEANRTTIDEARNYRESAANQDYGLGFSLTEDDPFVLLDYDDARDPETGEITSTVRQHIEEAGSYADVSTSGTGVHIIARGELSADVRSIEAEYPEEEFSLEVYDRGRYSAMSGQHLTATPERTTEAQGLLDRLEAEHATRTSRGQSTDQWAPRKSREEIADIAETTDIQDVFDSIHHVRPEDIRLRSTVTEKRSDGSVSLDPSWVDSESGTRLAQLEDGWIYRKGMHALDALQIVALEERLITDPGEYPSDGAFWEAVSALRERGADIPRYVSENGNNRM